MEEQLKSLVYNISLERLNITHFRCFDKLEINFDEKLTVFIAENGGGKTTILEAIAECLKLYLATLKVKGYETKLLPQKDVKVGQYTAHYELLADVDYIVNNTYPMLDDEGNQIIDDDDIEQFIVEDIPKNEVVKVYISTSAQDIKNRNNRYAFFREVAPIETYVETDLPILVYYDGNSVKTEYREKEKTSFEKIDMVYKNALDGERFSLTTFYNWWKEKEDKLLRTANKNSPEYKTIDSQFAKLRTAVELLLNDNEALPTYTNLRINENLLIGMDKHAYKENGELESTLFVEVAQFSAGEKSLFAFVADLGVRLLNAHPLRQDRQVVKDVAADGKLGVFEGRGIVLIDEVDLHLHPKWQRKVLDRLRKTFPEVQFVITTHSPFVVSSIQPQNLHLIVEDPKSNKKVCINAQNEAKYTKGLEPNRILKEIMGTPLRDLETQEKMDELNRLLKIDYNSSIVTQLLAELTENLGKSDSFIMRVQQEILMLRRKKQPAHEVH